MCGHLEHNVRLFCIPSHKNGPTQIFNKQEDAENFEYLCDSYFSLASAGRNLRIVIVYIYIVT